MANEKYVEKSFNLRGLVGIPDEQIEFHLKLYSGYVANVNKLLAKIRDNLGKEASASPEHAEMVRRLGWEINGMRLHDLYFDNLTSGGKTLNASSGLGKAIGASFGSYENWLSEFNRVAMMRGVGWAILYKDPVNGNLTNHWISSHEEGHPAGFTPILVMDIWEHAFTVYLKPTERGKYIEHFLANINWEEAERRF